MPTVLAQDDFAANCSTKKLKLPSMPVSVTFDNADVDKAFKKDPSGTKAIHNDLIKTALDQLLESKKKVQSAILDFDKKFEPSPDEKTNEDAIKTFNKTCNDIVNAQEDKAVKAVEAVWSKYASSNKQWQKAKIKCAVKVSLTTIGLATSIAAAAASHGVTAPAVLKMVASTIEIAKEIIELTQSIDKVEEDIVKSAETLLKRYKNLDWKTAAAKEIAAALGADFIASVGKFDDALKTHDGKIGELQKKRDGIYQNATGLVAEIKKSGDKSDKKTDKIGEKADKLLDKVGDLKKAIDDARKFQATHEKNLEMFEKKSMPGNEKLAQAVEIAKELKELFEITKELKDLI